MNTGLSFAHERCRSAVHVRGLSAFPTATAKRGAIARARERVREIERELCVAPLQHVGQHYHAPPLLMADISAGLSAGLPCMGARSKNVRPPALDGNKRWMVAAYSDTDTEALVLLPWVEGGTMVTVPWPPL